jgi:DNA polymerase-3 subunit chi
MTEVRFYHLQRKTLDQALPPLLEKVLERGMRAVVVAGSEERVEALTQWLWVADPASFLPHGSRRDGAAAEQPIWLTTAIENPNGAQVLVLTDGAGGGFESGEAGVGGDGVGGDGVGGVGAGFTLVCDLFDGNDPGAVAQARQRWRGCKTAGLALTYWQQSAEGRWERKS